MPQGEGTDWGKDARLDVRRAGDAAHMRSLDVWGSPRQDQATPRVRSGWLVLDTSGFYEPFDAARKRLVPFHVGAEVPI